MTIRIQDAEFTLFGVRLLVDYTYTEGVPETHINPAEPAEVELERVLLANTFEDAYDLLESIKVNVRMGRGIKYEYENGYDLLEDEIKKAHQR